MGLLPLLHVIKHDSFVPKKPFVLPSVKKDILQTLFCGLDVQKFLSELPQSDRYAFYLNEINHLRIFK